MARCLLVTFGLALLFTVVVGKVPSYIQVCGQLNPEFNKCVVESVTNMKDKLRTGFPELDVPSIDPLGIKELPLAELPEFRAVATNVKLGGITNFVVTNLNFDLKNSRIDLDARFPNITIDSDFNVRAKILVPITENGPVNSYSENVVTKSTFRIQKITRKGKNYVYFPSMTMKLKITDYTAVFKAGSNENPIVQAINSIMVNSRDEIIASMTPNIEKAISEKVLEIANKICKNFTYEELFPYRM